LFRILPSARWQDSAEFLLNWLLSAVLIFLSQALLLFIGFEAVALTYSFAVELDNCRLAGQCGTSPLLAAAHALVGNIPYLSLLGIGLLMVLLTTAAFMQIGWLTLAALVTYCDRRTPSLLEAMVTGLMQWHRGIWLGLLPMRLVAFATSTRTTALAWMDWRWRILIFGRMTYFSAASAHGATHPEQGSTAVRYSSRIQTPCRVAG